MTTANRVECCVKFLDITLERLTGAERLAIIEAVSHAVGERHAAEVERARQSELTFHASRDRE